MIGFLLSFVLGVTGKWRWLGYAFLIEFLIIGAAGLLRGDSDSDLVLIVLIPLAELGLGYGLGALWFRWRRGVWPRDRAIANLIPIRHGLDEDGQETLYWEVEAPVLTPQVMRVFGVVILGLFIAITVLFSLLRGGDIAAGAAIASIGCTGVVILFAFVIFGLLFNRLRRIYLFTDGFFATIISDPRLFTGVLASGALAVPSAQPAMLGAAIAAAGSRGERHDWKTIAAARYEPEHCRIRLHYRKGGWLGRDCIHCHPEGYPAASAWVARHIGYAGSPKETGTSKARRVESLDY